MDFSGSYLATLALAACSLAQPLAAQEMGYANQPANPRGATTAPGF